MSTNHELYKVPHKMLFPFLYAIIAHFLKGLKKARNTSKLQTQHAMFANAPR